MYRWIASCCILLFAACGDNAPGAPPTLFDRTVTTAEDTPVTVEVSVKATELAALVLTVATPPSHGTLTGNGPSWTYTPAANFNGTDTIVVHGEDRFGSSDATVTLIVTAVDDAPVANPDSFADDFNVPLTIPLATLLANDTDLDSPSLTVTGVLATSHGVPVLGETSLVFTPETGFEGAATFEYTISDGTLSAHATVTVTIGVDHPPVAIDDAVTTAEDTTAAIADATLLANDTDVDLQTLQISAVGNPSHGSVTHTGTQVSFVPDANFHGDAGFDYTVTDGFRTDVGSVVVTVTSVNDPPVAVADVAQTNEDTPLTIAPATLVANDTDLDGDALTLTAVASTANTHGSVGLSEGQVLYVPASNFNGTADFEYTVSDGNGGTATGLVTVTVVPVNDAPLAVSDTLTTAEDTPVDVQATTLAANDTDVDGDALTVTAVAATVTTHGSVTLSAGTVTYTPAANYNGAADFNYTVSDGHGGTATGSVQVTVTSVNDAPVVTTSEGLVHYTENAAPVALDSGITVTDLDSATLVGATVQLTGGCTSPEDVLALTPPPPPIRIPSPPGSITAAYVAATCTLSLTGVATVAAYQAALRAVTYVNTSDNPATADRSVLFTVDDGQAANNTGSDGRTLSVTAVDDTPVAVADAATVMEDSGATAIPVLGNDTDVDAGPISISSVTQPAHGAVVITGGGTGLTYAPNADYCNRIAPPLQGPAQIGDTFTYTLSPGGSTATVAMTVLCVDDPPVAVDDAATVAEGDSNVPLDVLANDTDIDGGPRTVASITQPSHGSATIGPSGLSVLYTPAPGYCNQVPNAARDTFTYTLTPGGSSATVSVTVLCACGKNKPTDFVVGSN